MRFDWIITNFSRIWDLTLSHITLSIAPIVLSLLIALPIGWLAHRKKALREVLVTVTSALYVIPSLALFIIMPLIMGTSILPPLNVIAAMTLYGLALQVRSTTDAFDTVPAPVASAATAMGYSPLARVLKVELPLAGHGILSGLRVVSASTISLVSVGALIGVQSLGTLFTEGFQRSFPTQIMAGLLGCIILALVFDAVLVLIGKLLMPWSRRVS